MKRKQFKNREVLTPRMIEDIRLAKIAEADRQEAIKADIGVVHKQRMARWKKAAWNNYRNKLIKR